MSDDLGRFATLAMILGAGAWLAACSSGSGPGATGTTTGSGGSTGTTIPTLSGTGGTAGAAGSGGEGCVDTGPATTTFVPGPADIQFAAKNPLPAGEQLVFNDWNPSPNTLSSLTLDGATKTILFEAYRLWSVGVSRAGDKIAFACGDPDQQMHYGLGIGDAIQHTWLYDAAAQTASLLSDGNVNDECHVFGPGDASIYICRRYDFTNCGLDKGYRIGRIDLPSAAFTFISPEDPDNFYLHAQPTTDSVGLLSERIKLANNGRDVLTQSLPSGTPAVLLAQAGSPVISPDGTRFVYADYTDGGALHVALLDGTQSIAIAEHGTSTTWSPDGKKIAYLKMDDALNCSHIEVVPSDGSAQPTRIRDCGTTNEFITELAWFTR